MKFPFIISNMLADMTCNYAGHYDQVIGLPRFTYNQKATGPLNDYGWKATTVMVLTNCTSDRKYDRICFNHSIEPPGKYEDLRP